VELNMIQEKKEDTNAQQRKKKWKSG